MIVVDTHTWVWWTLDTGRLSVAQYAAISRNEDDLIGVSAVSCSEVAIESTRLPGSFHRDPADQIIVATARIHDCDLVTSDDKIVEYPHVRTIL